MRKLPRHIHYLEESSPVYQSITSQDWIPQIDWAKLATTIQDTITAAGAWITSVLKTIYDAGAVAWTTLATAVQNTITAAGAWIGTVVETIKTLGKVAWDVLTTTLQNTINAAGAWIGTVIETIKIAGAVAWAHLAAALQTIINNAAAWIGTVVETIKTAGKVAWDVLTTTLQTTINAAGAWIGSVIETIKIAGNVAWAVLSTSVQNIINTAGAWIGTIIESIKTAGAVATTYLSGVIQSAQMALSSFADGFFAGASGLAKFVTDFFSGATGRAKFANDLALPFTKLEAVPYKLPTSAYNYIVNPSYEYGTWGGSETQSEDYAKFGKYSAKIVASGATLSSGYSNFVNVRGLSTITVSVWLKITSYVSGNLATRIYYYNSAKTELGWEWSGSLGAITDWTRVEITKTSFPANTCFIRVCFLAALTPIFTGYVDGWQFHAGDQIPAFQDFTAYSFNWCPEKIETSLATDTSWSSDTWTTVLTLPFDCDSTMLCLVFVYAQSQVVRPTEGIAIAYFRLLLDDSEMPITNGWIGSNQCHANQQLTGDYSLHTIAIVVKGTHNIKLQMKCYASSMIVYAYNRRLSVLKGFYNGGTT